MLQVVLTRILCNSQAFNRIQINTPSKFTFCRNMTGRIVSVVIEMVIQKDRIMFHIRQNSETLTC